MSSVPAPLVPKQFETILQGVTLSMLGIDPASSGAYAKVRIGWQTEGAPAWAIEDDVAILRAVEEDNPYNRVRDREVLPNPADPSGDTVILQDVYTSIWRVYWVLYGPNSFDNGRKIRSGLFNDAIHDVLAGSNVYLVTDVTAPVRVPELFGGRWWERVDFSALFNEMVVEQTVIGTVGSVEVIIETTG